MENEKEKMKCYACGKLASPAEFPVVHGDIGPNIGICRECSRKGIMVSVSSEPPAESKPITDEEYANAFAVFTDNFNNMLNALTPKAEVEAWRKALRAFITIYRYRLHQLKLLQGVNDNE